MPPRRPRRTVEERATRTAMRMSAGTLAGRVESASPARLRDARVFRNPLGAAGNHTLIIEVTGPVFASGYNPFYPLFDATMTAVRGTVNQAPSGSDLEFDIRKNGTSIFTTLPIVADGQLIGTTVVPTTTTWVADDKIQLVVITGAQALGLMVSIEHVR